MCAWRAKCGNMFAGVCVFPEAFARVFTRVCLCVYSGVCQRVGVDLCVNSAPAVERSTDAETEIEDYG